MTVADWWELAGTGWRCWEKDVLCVWGGGWLGLVMNSEFPFANGLWFAVCGVAHGGTSKRVIKSGGQEGY